MNQAAIISRSRIRSLEIRRPSRPRFGEGGLAAEPAKSVFINCPFDAEYSTLFDAIVFATVCCGFMPRCALESGTVSEPRLARIPRAIFNSRYSIHDLSRCRGEGDENFARFNMPLELGMAMAKRFMDPVDEHDWLVLVPRDHAYLRFISDLAAYDGVVTAVMAWLSTRKDAIPPITPTEALYALTSFTTEKAKLDAAWSGQPPWPDIVLAAIRVARSIE